MNSDLREDVWKIFQDFLEAEGAAETYNRMCNTGVSYSPVRLWIGGAFLWSAAPEGSAYWGSMSRKWKDIIEEVDGIK